MHAHRWSHRIRPATHRFPETSTASRKRPLRSLLRRPCLRLLLHEGRGVLIGGRAFDLLMALLQARGHLIDKNEIVRKVWPSTTVEECNIRFQIGTLRKIYSGSDGDLIKTIPGRGYHGRAGAGQSASAT